MMRLLFAFLALLIACSQTHTQAGVLTLTMIPSNDLSSLTVGQTFSVDVELGGLDGGLTLNDLTSTVLFSQPSFREPLSGDTVELGPIVSDPFDFFSLVTTNPGGAVVSIDGQFLSLLPSNNISGNGTFFSFTLEATATGSGTVAFDPIVLTARDDLGNLYLDENDFFADPDYVIRTNSLDYNVTGASTVVPEPASIACFGLLAAIGILSARRDKRLRKRPFPNTLPQDSHRRFDAHQRG